MFIKVKLRIHSLLVLGLFGIQNPSWNPEIIDYHIWKTTGKDVKHIYLKVLVYHAYHLYSISLNNILVICHTPSRSILRYWNWLLLDAAHPTVNYGNVKHKTYNLYFQNIIWCSTLQWFVPIICIFNLCVDFRRWTSHSTPTEGNGK